MKARYALRAMSELARAGQQRLHARELTTRCRAPGKFLETILVDLRSAGFLDSRRGQRGGHALARPPEQIMIGDLIRAIDGPLAAVRCASVTAYLPCSDCPDPDACELRALMRESRDAIARVLDGRSLREFAAAAPGAPR